MNQLDRILGKLVGSKFNEEYPRWKESLDYLINLLGILNLEEELKDWAPIRISYRELVEYLLRKRLKFGFLCRFPIDIDEDPYGKCYWSSRITRRGIREYLKSKDAFWALDNHDLILELLDDDSDFWNKLLKVQDDYNKKFDFPDKCS